MGKTILILAVVVLLGLILINRERVFVRDPVAKVYRNEVRQSGVQVFINYSNDVLLEQDYSDGATSRIMVQNWNQIPGTPAGLICIRWMACVTGDDHAPINPLAQTAKRNYDPKVTMTNREVSFVDGDGSKLRIELR